ncbi:DUF4003 family protein [Lysinibacillus sp. BW-2-10]|uniref:DUF4003 family protein n=1 Tax=Lysinibacillus sp. BW-2-10 TaxID=2590030 RepID=UPI00117FD027|nr:DUF4003 family protein [Lysinibacillus sp. BW-2-10]TSI11002.1 DUF4003 family protein [Lysinibacillus sp. BW-2-10]
MDNEQFIIAFEQNYQRVINYIGSGVDQQLVMSLACKYTLAKKPFSGVMLQKVIDQVDEMAKGALPIRNSSTISYRFAAQLVLGNGDIPSTLPELIENDHLLKEAKFKSSPFRAIGALFLQGDKEQHAARAKELYTEMNRNQRILTSAEDIPYVVYLTIPSDTQALVQAETIDRYYNELRKHQFAMGNHLQALAQIATIYSSTYNEVLLHYVIQLKEELTKRNIKLKKMHYPYLGVLALAATNNMKMDEIANLYNQLMEQKIFKNAKHYALIVAIQKIVQDLMEVQELLNVTPVAQLLNLTDLLDIADIFLELGWFLPSGISEVVDFFN